MNKLQKFYSTSPLLKNNLIFFVGSMAVAVLNYLFYPLISRFVEPAEFGEIQILTTLTAQTALLFALAKLVIVNIVSNSRSKASSIAFYHQIENIILQASIILSVVALLALPLLKNIFQFESIIPLLVTLPVISLGALRICRDSYARGISAFAISSISEFLASLLKLMIVAVLLALGFQTIGGGLSITLSYLVGASMIYYYTGKRGLKPIRLSNLLKQRPKSIRINTLSVDMRSSLIVAAAGLFATIFANIDTITAKSVFEPNIAGLYSSISIIANSILFATASIAGVLLSSIKVTNTHHKNIRIYLFSALLMFSITACALLIFSLAPQKIIQLAVGDSYTAYSNLLPIIAFAMAAMAGINLIIYYHMALRDRGIFLIALLIMVVIVTNILIDHAYPKALANSFLRGNLIAFVVCIIYTVIWNIRFQNRVKLRESKNVT